MVWYGNDQHGLVIDYHALGQQTNLVSRLNKILWRFSSHFFFDYFSMKKVSQLGLDTVTLRLEGPAIIIIISIIIIMLESQMMLIPCVIIQICFVYELLLQLLHKLNFQGWFLLSDLAHWPSDPLSMTMLLMMRGDMGDQTRAGSQSEISFATEKITQTDGNSSCKHFLFIFSHI